MGFILPIPPKSSWIYRIETWIFVKISFYALFLLHFLSTKSGTRKGTKPLPYFKHSWKIFWSNLSLSWVHTNRASLFVPPSWSHAKVHGGKWEVGFIHVWKIRLILSKVMEKSSCLCLGQVHLSPNLSNCSPIHSIQYDRYAERPRILLFSESCRPFPHCRVNIPTSTSISHKSLLGHPSHPATNWVP